MFRVIVQTRLIGGQPHFHARILAKRKDHERVCGIVTLRPAEWLAFCRVCDLTGIEVRDEPGPVLKEIRRATIS